MNLQMRLLVLSCVPLLLGSTPAAVQEDPGRRYPITDHGAVSRDERDTRSGSLRGAIGDRVECGRRRRLEDDVSRHLTDEGRPWLEGTGDALDLGAPQPALRHGAPHEDYEHHQSRQRGRQLELAFGHGASAVGALGPRTSCSKLPARSPAG